jgi:hypothetical protein
MNIRPLTDRLALPYGDQVEFIRFRERALDCESALRDYDNAAKRLEQIRTESLEEIERLMAAAKESK